MKPLRLREARKRSRPSRAQLWIEFTPTEMRARTTGDGVEMPIERLADGRLSNASRDEIRSALERLKPTRTGVPLDAICALPLSGVTVRGWDLPRSSREELRQALELQLEAELPLPPESLAWGFTQRPSTNGACSLTLAAIRQDVLGDYESLLSSCELRATYRIAALARVANPSGTTDRSASDRAAVLSLGSRHSELSLFHGPHPVRAQVISWGTDDLLDDSVADETDGRREALRERDALSVLDHGKSVDSGHSGRLSNGSKDALLPSYDRKERLARAASSSFERLADRLRAPLAAGAAGSATTDSPARLRLFVTGSAFASSCATALASLLPGVEVERLELPQGPGVSAATAALEEGTPPTIELAIEPAAQDPRADAPVATPPSTLRWVIVTAVLAVAWLGARYGAPLIDRTRLREELAASHARLEALPPASRDLGFLREVQTRRERTEYLDLLAALTRVAPEGTLLSNVTCSEQGSLTIEGSTTDSAAANAFRHNVLECGLFATAVLEDIRPSEERSRFRLRADSIPQRTLAVLDAERFPVREGPIGAEMPSESESTAEPTESTKSPGDSEPSSSEESSQPASTDEATIDDKPTGDSKTKDSASAPSDPANSEPKAPAPKLEVQAQEESAAPSNDNELEIEVFSFGGEQF